MLAGAFKTPAIFFLTVFDLFISGDSVNSEDNKERYNKENKAPERRTKELDGYVGFANLPNQVYRKAVKKGFDFTLMVVGEF